MERADPFQWAGATIDGKYRIEEVVGEGGFGVVYRGHHLGFDEPVAVKCLKIPRELSGGDREKFQQAFLEEGKLLHRLSRATAGIVQALDVGAATSPSGAWTPYLVLEWLEGVPLDRDLATRRAQDLPPRSLPEAVALLAPAARALAAAHAQGVAHRDIKPANLFLADVGTERTIKVLDFGIAKVLSTFASMTQAFAETGSSVKSFTPQYGAPEQFNRRFGATGPWTDVFALALVLIEVTSGRAALDGTDTTQLYIASTDNAFRPSFKQAGVEVPEAVEAVVRRALSVEPRERYHTAGELWDALVAVVPEASPAGKQALTGAPGLRATTAKPVALSGDLAVMPTGEFLVEVARTESATPHVEAPEPFVAASTKPMSTAATGEADVPPQAPKEPPVSPPARRRGPGVWIGGAVAAVAVLGGGAFLWQSRTAPLAEPSPSAPEITTSAKAPPPPIPSGMVRVPAGKFLMGSESGGRTEKPPHEVTLTKAFDLDRTEVTAADYQRCVKAGKCTASSVHGAHVEPGDAEKRGPLCTAADPARARHPINCVDRMQAAAYCAWAGKRLPTEAEWEYAARGADGRDYPWGNEPADCEHAIVAASPPCKNRKGTAEVGSIPAGASPTGALDMAGNVWEWVADGWDPAVYTKGAQTDPRAPDAGDKGVLRGGSWDFAASKSKATFRLAFDRGAADVATGVRCAKTVDTP